MAYDDHLAERITQNLNNKGISFEEKKMFGGWCAMVQNKMCVGIVGKDLMVRIDPEDYLNFLKMDHVRPMDFNGRPMKGYLFVNNYGIDEESALTFWIEECLKYNPKAKSSKK
jgi:hypothetical protein